METGTIYGYTLTEIAEKRRGGIVELGFTTRASGDVSDPAGCTAGSGAHTTARSRPPTAAGSGAHTAAGSGARTASGSKACTASGSRARAAAGSKARTAAGSVAHTAAGRGARTAPGSRAYAAAGSGTHSRATRASGSRPHPRAASRSGARPRATSRFIALGQLLYLAGGAKEDTVFRYIGLLEVSAESKIRARAEGLPSLRE